MTLKITGFKISFNNPLELWDIYKDIFILKTYYFKPTTKPKLILDCGGHIGLSVLYFKKSYPHSKIICFEPDPKNFKLLKKNVSQNYLKNVILINAAVSNKTGNTKFFTNKNWKPFNKKSWSWGNSLIKHPEINDQTHEVIKINTVKLSDYIKEPVDLIKLDIEGMETNVLKEIEPKLKLVKNIVIEFHHHDIPKGNILNKITEILERKKFTLTYRKGKDKVQKGNLVEQDSYIIISGTKN